MIFEDKTVVLKNGQTALFKTPEAVDGERMLRFTLAAFAETDFLSRYPEECLSLNAEQEAKKIENGRKSGSSLTICCFIDGRIAGKCDLRFRDSLKTCHRAVIGVSVLSEFWGLNIGSVFFKEMISAAKERGAEIIELHFEEGNLRGQRLYEKFGFEVFGSIPRAVKLKDGSYRSLLYMQKSLI